MSDPTRDPARLLCRLDELPPGACREFRLGAGDWPLRGFVVRVSSVAGATGATGAASAPDRVTAGGATSGGVAPDGVRAYVNRCAHLAYPLNYLPDEFLTYDRSHIQCSMHGALFDKQTGLCVAGPCFGRSLVALPVRVHADCVWLTDEVDIAALLARLT